MPAIQIFELNMTKMFYLFLLIFSDVTFKGLNKVSLCSIWDGHFFGWKLKWQLTRFKGIFFFVFYLSLFTCLCPFLSLSHSRSLNHIHSFSIMLPISIFNGQLWQMTAFPSRAPLVWVGVRTSSAVVYLSKSIKNSKLKLVYCWQMLKWSVI